MYLNFQHLVDSFFYRDDNIYAWRYNGERFVSTGYQQLYTKAKAIAKYLQSDCGLHKGDRVGLISENRPEWMMAYLGIVYNGLVVVPLDTMLSPQEIKNLICISKVTRMFISAEIFNKLKDDKDILSLVDEWILFEEYKELKTIPCKITFLDNVILQPDTHSMARHEVFQSDIASMIFTSGTTGNSKAVLLTQGNCMHQVNNLWIAAYLTEKDVILSVLPLHHTFQFSVEITTLGVGGTITYAESMKPNRLIENISNTKVTIMIGIPLLYAKILDGIQRNIKQQSLFVQAFLKVLYGASFIAYFITGSHKIGKILFAFLRRKAGFSSVEFLISGAAPLPYDVSQGYAIFGFNLANGYGMTEASPVISVGDRYAFVDNKSVGNAIPKVSWKIADPDTEGIGEICIKGPNVMLAYADNPKATQDVLTNDGWLKTGDIGYIGRRFSKEYLYITGRCKNIIITSGGKNVYPEEIELRINEAPYIDESLVLGVPVSDTDKGEIVCALIVIKLEYCESQDIDPYGQYLKDLVDKHIRDINTQLQIYQKIRNYEIRYEEFHKNSTRKVKRYEYKGVDFKYLLK